MGKFSLDGWFVVEKSIIHYLCIYEFILRMWYDGRKIKRKKREEEEENLSIGNICCHQIVQRIYFYIFVLVAVSRAITSLHRNINIHKVYMYTAVVKWLADVSINYRSLVLPTKKK